MSFDLDPPRKLGMKLAILTGMFKKRILIIDDAGFSKVCSAILGSEGFGTEVLANEMGELAKKLDQNEFGLVITSYPYGNVLLEELKKRAVPLMILATHIDTELMSVLDNKTTYCMLKPLNYQKFTLVIKQVMAGDYDVKGEYNIV